MNLSSDFFDPPPCLNVDRRSQAYPFHGRASPFSFARFTRRTPPSPDLQSPCSTNIVMRGIKPHRRAHPCRHHQSPDPVKRTTDLSNEDILCFFMTGL
ncbi:hypothetical protein Bca4012_036253 [Brassica carinata]|uniref:Uncharacterized protein n=1 Tax=Brassica carinata TaxID=52824 RepID=A0A8X7WE83_BRACI|nr:hypothetical protein Bca52824_009983 [Brassica carinata]